MPAYENIGSTTVFSALYWPFIEDISRTNNYRGTVPALLFTFYLVSGGLW